MMIMTTMMYFGVRINVRVQAGKKSAGVSGVVDVLLAEDNQKEESNRSTRIAWF